MLHIFATPFSYILAMPISKIIIIINDKLYTFMEAILAQKDSMHSKTMFHNRHYVQHAHSKDCWRPLVLEAKFPIDIYCSLA